MSNTLREYPSLDLGRTMSVTAFVGGKWGYGIQFTIGMEYCAMGENQVRDLRNTLTRRLQSRKGYRATEGGEPTIVIPGEIKDGS